MPSISLIPNIFLFDPYCKIIVKGYFYGCFVVGDEIIFTGLLNHSFMSWKMESMLRTKPINI